MEDLAEKGKGKGERERRRWEGRTERQSVNFVISSSTKSPASLFTSYLYSEDPLPCVLVSSIACMLSSTLEGDHCDNAKCAHTCYIVEGAIIHATLMDELPTIHFTLMGELSHSTLMNKLSYMFYTSG